MNNLKTIEAEMDWIELVINQSISSYLMQEGHENRWYDIELPPSSDTAYHIFLKKNNINLYERLTLAITIATVLQPQILDIFFGKNEIYDRLFTEFGGNSTNSHSGFFPTIQTVLFIITSTNIEFMNKAATVFKPSSILMKKQVIELSNQNDSLLFTNQLISINERWLNYFITGIKKEQEQSLTFPAKRVTTELKWEDVVLSEEVIEEIEEIIIWLKNSDKIMNEWKLSKRLKPGYRTLFYGPPGTGKTLTATLLGKATKRLVYRVDLSMIVSKYIGETEKNLARVFDIAENSDWILFFDEADSLFGKRTEANSSNDKHANQQTGYLLQRIESFPGVVILASNLKDNIDPAFSRRFQSMIHFKMPNVEERYQLWKSAFDDTLKLSEDIDLFKVAEEYELAGGAIINVLRHCALRAVEREDQMVIKSDLVNGLRKEYRKKNKTLVKRL